MQPNISSRPSDRHQQISTSRKLMMLVAVFALLSVLTAALHAQDFSAEDLRHPLASPFVSMDSPLYRLADRLAAGGLLDPEFLGQRPWTRTEFARLVDSASALVYDPEYEWAKDDYDRLHE